MISPAEARQKASIELAGFRAGIARAYLAYVDRQDLAHLRLVILPILEHALPQAPAHSLIDLPGSMQLVEDLGCDSLTLIDTLFIAEGLFDVSLGDDKLDRVVTIDDLLAYFHTQLTRGSAPSG